MKITASHLRLALCLFTLALSIALLSESGEAQQGKYKTLGYRSCGTERGTCHQGDGNWWLGDPHSKTVNDLKRKQQRSMQIAQAYGMKPADYLKGTSLCASCHGEVVSGREASNMNAGVSCESCHGSAGPEKVGYYEVHQEGTNPKDPLDTSRSGRQKAMKVGMVELRNLDNRATTCVRCHQINEKKLLEAGHPTGEGFDYVSGIKNNISRHWDYKVRTVDLDVSSFQRALSRKPIPGFTLKITDAPVAVSGPVVADTVFVYVDGDVPAWMSPADSIAIKAFEPNLSEDAPLDSILMVIKNYIEYVHKRINGK